jgi:hypothetical protein
VSVYLPSVRDAELLVLALEELAAEIDGDLTPALEATRKALARRRKRG